MNEISKSQTLWEKYYSIRNEWWTYTFIFLLSFIIVQEGVRKYYVPGHFCWVLTFDLDGKKWHVGLKPIEAMQGVWRVKLVHCTIGEFDLCNSGDFLYRTKGFALFMFFFFFFRIIWLHYLMITCWPLPSPPGKIERAEKIIRCIDEILRHLLSKPSVLIFFWITGSICRPFQD